MQLGRVIGTATATVKHPTFQGERLLVVQLETGDGRPDGEPVLAFDRLGAGGATGALHERRASTSGATGADNTRPLERDGAARSVKFATTDSTQRLTIMGQAFLGTSRSRIGVGHAPIPHGRPRTLVPMIPLIGSVKRRCGSVLAGRYGRARPLEKTRIARSSWASCFSVRQVEACRRVPSRSGRPGRRDHAAGPRPAEAAGNHDPGRKSGRCSNSRCEAVVSGASRSSRSRERAGAAAGLARRSSTPGPSSSRPNSTAVDGVAAGSGPRGHAGSRTRPRSRSGIVPGARGPRGVGRRARRRRPRGDDAWASNLLVVEPAGKSISWMKQLGDGLPAGRGARRSPKPCRREGRT